MGSAARGAAHGLRRKGFRPIVAPESFYVVDAKGPLADGELARARTWGAYLAAQVSPKQQQGAA